MTDKQEPQILHLALIRTGTASMARAYEILGYRDVYHGLKMMDRLRDWAILEKAAEATFPHVAKPDGISPRPWEREDWDQLFGTSEAITDLGSFFAPQLIAAYPNTKVVLVERNFDKWWHSVEDVVLYSLWSPGALLFTNWIEPITGSRSGITMRKIMMGFFEADDVAEVRQNARRRYDEHYRLIRETVPADRILEYRLGDGWGPLCKFLGKEVPDEAFPWVNEADELKRIVWRRLIKYSLMAARVVGGYLLAAVVVGIAVWLVRPNSRRLLGW